MEFFLTTGVDGYSTLKEDEELSVNNRDTRNVLMKNKVLIEWERKPRKDAECRTYCYWFSSLTA